MLRRQLQKLKIIVDKIIKRIVLGANEMYKTFYEP